MSKRKQRNDYFDQCELLDDEPPQSRLNQSTKHASQTGAVKCEVHQTRKAGSKHNVTESTDKNDEEKQEEQDDDIHWALFTS